MVNYPLEYCPYCGTELEVVEWPKYYRCRSCDDWVFHNAVLGGGTVVVDDDRLLLIEDFRTPGEWKLPEGRPEIPESPREGVARELEEETGLSVDPEELVYLYDEAAEPVEDQFMMGIYYAVDRSATTGTVQAGSDATEARFFSPEEFAASEQTMKEHHANPFWFDDLELLMELAQEALEREVRYSSLVAPHVDGD